LQGVERPRVIDRALQYDVVTMHRQQLIIQIKDDFTVIDFFKVDPSITHLLKQQFFFDSNARTQNANTHHDFLFSPILFLFRRQGDL